MNILVEVCTFVGDISLVLATTIAVGTGLGVLGGWISWHCRDQGRGPMP